MLKILSRMNDISLVTRYIDIISNNYDESLNKHLADILTHEGWWDKLSPKVLALIKNNETLNQQGVFISLLKELYFEKKLSPDQEKFCHDLANLIADGVSTSTYEKQLFPEKS